MKIIAVLNQKGGTSKTTTVINLGAALAEKKKRVLLIDLDPQQSASLWLRRHSEGKGLYSVFTENASIADIVMKTGIDGLDIIPSTPLLMSADKALSSEIGAEFILRDRLVGLKKSWDYCLIDCPPGLGVLALNALCAAHSVLVPVETSAMALQGLLQLTKTISQIQARLNPGLTIEGILPSRVDKRTRLSQDIIQELKTRLDGKLFPVSIRETVKLRECPSFGVPINVYDPKGAGAEDFRALAKELIKRA